MADPDYMLKLNRAGKHRKAVFREVKALLNGDHHTVVTKDDPARDNGFLVFASAEPIPLDPLAVLIGDVLQNMRNALDHIAYHLAAKFTVPLPVNIAQDSEFPIIPDVDKSGPGVGPRLFKGAKRKIAGIDPKAQAVIEGLQPYHRGNDFVTDPLWKLHDLGRIDKHRLLHPVVASFDGIYINPGKSFNAVMLPGVLESLAGTVEQDTPIARYLAKADNPKLPMHMHIEPALGIAFPQGSVAAGEKVMDVLIEIDNHIRKRVLVELAPYL